jgi:hypothetical protein
MRSLGKPRHRWRILLVNIDLKETGWDGMDWIHLTQDMNHCRFL